MCRSGLALGIFGPDERQAVVFATQKTFRALLASEHSPQLAYVLISAQVLDHLGLPSLSEKTPPDSGG